MPPLDDKEVPACHWMVSEEFHVCVGISEPPAGYKYISVVMTDRHVRNPQKLSPILSLPQCYLEG